MDGLVALAQTFKLLANNRLLFEGICQARRRTNGWCIEIDAAGVKPPRDFGDTALRRAVVLLDGC